MFDRQRIERAALGEALRQMPAAVVIAEAPSGKIIFRNTRAQQIGEQSLNHSWPTGPTTLDSASDLGIFHPDGRPYEMEEWPLMRSISSGEEVRGEEFVYPLADSTRLLVRCDSFPIYDDEGRIVAGVLIAHGITEQKRAEEGLRESSRQIENILESITDVFVAIDRQWRYTYINERALRRMQGRKGQELSREEFLGENMWEEFPEAVGTTIYHKYHEAIRERKTVEFETYFPPSDEWIEAHAYPSEEGLAIYYRDITERKRVEEQLRYHAHLLENIHDAVIATDEQLAVTAWNKGAEQMYGWSADEVLGRYLWEAIPIDLSEDQRAEVLRELSESGQFRIEAITYAMDGTPVWVEGITIALREEEPDGEITGYVN